MSVGENIKNPKKAGRHRMYSTDALKQILYKFVEECGGKITPAKLEKYSNIKRHIWEYDEEVMAEIDRLANPMNRIGLFQDMSKFDFRNINIEHVILSEKNPKETVLALRMFQLQAELALEEGAKYHKLLAEKVALQDKYEGVVNDLKQEIDGANLRVRTLRDKNKKLEDEIKTLNETISGFEDIILQYGLDCSSLKKRLQNNIKDNATRYTPERDEEVLSKAFPKLFSTL